MKLIVGLGNPGKKYEKTRHNVGFLAIDKIASNFSVDISKSFKNGIYGDFLFCGEKVILLKPTKYMNLSGEVIREYLDYFKLSVDDMLVIYDDMDTETGKFKIKKQGSAAGHNGLRNIELNLATQEYNRFKIGISKNPLMDKADYVLGKLSNSEMEQISEVINLAPKIIEDYLKIDFEKLMSKYNLK